MTAQPASLPLLDATEVARRLGIKRSAVYALAASGRLICYRVGASGGAVRFHPDDLTNYLQSCRSAGTPETSAGATSSTVTLKAGGTGLLGYFQRAGVKPKLTHSTAPKAPGSTLLRLAPSRQTR